MQPFEFFVFVLFWVCDAVIFATSCVMMAQYVFQPSWTFIVMCVAIGLLVLHVVSMFIRAPKAALMSIPFAPFILIALYSGNSDDLFKSTSFIAHSRQRILCVFAYFLIFICACMQPPKQGDPVFGINAAFAALGVVLSAGTVYNGLTLKPEDNEGMYEALFK
jgi:hypothetical protein